MWAILLPMIVNGRTDWEDNSSSFDGDGCDTNKMCSCSNGDEGIVVLCSNVPLYKMFDFRNRKYYYVDIAESNVLWLDSESFGTSKFQSIRVTFSDVMYIAPKTFSFTGDVLQSINLNNNRLVQFPHKALRDIEKLDWLSVSGNEFVALDDEVEYYDERLKIRDTLLRLFLAENDIADLSNNYLARYSQLVSLNLNRNNLKSISPANFPSSVRTLSVESNQLTVVPVDVLDALPQLTSVMLTDNFVRQLSFQSFENVRQLTLLDLNSNFIDTVIGRRSTSLSSSSSLPSGGFYNNNNNNNKNNYNNYRDDVVHVEELRLSYNRLNVLLSGSFRGVTVNVLHLSQNRLEKIEDKALADLAGSLESLHLDNNRLTEVPAALKELKKLKYLYLSGNRIGNVSDSVIFDKIGSTLKIIILARNRLTRVPREALASCGTLAQINFSYNFLRELNERDFEQWGRNLVSLLLSNNKISEIGARVFRRMTKIKELSLSFNKLINIHKDAFVDLGKSLKVLHVSFGLLFQEDFTGDFLKPLSALQWILLNDNNVQTISANALSSLKRLQRFNMDGNRLSVLPNALFQPDVHKSLREIRFSNNRLTALRPNFLAGLHELENVALYRNLLTSVETDTFRDLPNLAVILMSNNRISALSDGAFVDLPSLQTIDLTNNRLDRLNLKTFLNVSDRYRPLTLNVSFNRIDSIIPPDIDNNNINNNNNNYNNNYDNGNNKVYLSVLDLRFNRLTDVRPFFLAAYGSSLKDLDLSNNQIRKLNMNSFSNLARLYRISLRRNNISYVHDKCLIGLSNLQILDLSINNIEYLPSRVFDDTNMLRIIDLSDNDIRSLPKNLFRLSRLEALDLSRNSLNVVPSLVGVKENLRRLDLSYNRIEHLDGTMLNEAPFLASLNLAHNRLTILPDNVFTSVGNLLILDVRLNPLRANFKELFHYLQQLRCLNLSATSLTEVPPLPLPRLLELRLSGNQITKMSSDSMENLSQLRRLYVDGNRLTHVPTNVWSYLPLLKELDISDNPIKILSADSFSKLSYLKILNIQDLNELQQIDADVFKRNTVLTELKLDSYERLEKSDFRLSSFISPVRTLRSLSLRILTEKLDSQVHGLFHSKLETMEITGRNLKYVRKDALKGIDRTLDLTLRMTGTSIEELPIGLLEGIRDVPYLKLDFSDNKLTSFSSAVLYYNVTNWENIGTKIVGELTLNDNPWHCDCGLVWLGHWIRRWASETADMHSLLMQHTKLVEDKARTATCLDTRTNQRIPIFDLHPEDLSCQASALSGDGSHVFGGTRVIVCVTRTLIVCAINRFIWYF